MINEEMAEWGRGRLCHKSGKYRLSPKNLVTIFKKYTKKKSIHCRKWKFTYVLSYKLEVKQFQQMAIR